MLGGHFSVSSPITAVGKAMSVSQGTISSPLSAQWASASFSRAVKRRKLQLPSSFNMARQPHLLTRATLPKYALLPDLRKIEDLHSNRGCAPLLGSLHSFGPRQRRSNALGRRPIQPHSRSGPATPLRRRTLTRRSESASPPADPPQRRRAPPAPPPPPDASRDCFRETKSSSRDGATRRRRRSARRKPVLCRR